MLMWQILPNACPLSMPHPSSILQQTRMFVWCAMTICPCLEIFGQILHLQSMFVHVRLCVPTIK